ncbi:imm11 family protein [Stappia indica]|uniref:imm11 family protein n=1 Tax=Stappia indica TaxID=538381 RepID=UPI00082E1DE6|nr:DUF1629 domain-containing protein [Stappia indica]
MAWLLELVYQAWSTPQFKFDDEDKFGNRGDKAFGLSQGFWVDPTKIPVSAQQTTKKRVPDVFPMPGCNAVSQRFKDLVEQFEPGIHQFFPLKLRRKSGFSIEQNYYVFNCMTSVDTVLVKESRFRWGRFEEIDKPRIDIDREKDIVLSRMAIETRHLWKGLYLQPIGSGVFCSDAFEKALKKKKIRFLKQTYCREIDVPWLPEENIQPALDWEAENGEPWGYRPRLRAQTLASRGKLEL